MLKSGPQSIMTHRRSKHLYVYSFYVVVRNCGLAADENVRIRSLCIDTEGDCNSLSEMAVPAASRSLITALSAYAIKAI